MKFLGHKASSDWRGCLKDASSCTADKFDSQLAMEVLDK